MRYLLLLAHAPDAWPETAASPEPRAAFDPVPASPESGVDPDVFTDWQEYTRALHHAGVLVDGAALHDAGTATTVRVRRGRRLLSDGPFVETKDELIGYYVIEVVSLDEALRWAARVPSVLSGAVEVRPVEPDSHTDAVLRTIGVVAEPL